MRFKEFLEEVEADKDFAFKYKKKIKTKSVEPMSYEDAKKKAKDQPENKTASAFKLKDLMNTSKKMGHTPSVAHAVGIYPA